MKKFFMLLTILMVPCLALAQAATPPAAYAPPQWLTDVLTWVQGIPKVGPIVIMVLTGLSVVATLMTLLSTFLVSVKASIQGVAKLSGAVTVIDTVESIYQKIAPYVMFLSMYNVQKKDSDSSATTPAQK